MMSSSLVNCINSILLYEMLMCSSWSPKYVDKADLHSILAHCETLLCSEGRDSHALYLHGQGWTDSMTLSTCFHEEQHVDLQVLLLSKQH